MVANNTRRVAERRPAKAPPTQEERSAATREKLLDAAIECLVELGYSRMTTTDVADQAGVCAAPSCTIFRQRSSWSPAPFATWPIAAWPICVAKRRRCRRASGAFRR